MARPKGRAQRQPAKPEASWRPGWGLYVGLALVLGVVALVVFGPQSPGEAFDDQGNFHLQSPDEPHPPYNSSPPSSGPHLGVLAQWGIHDTPLPPELFVHNLEDGGIVITYDCPDGCADLVADLSSLVTDLGDGVLLTPYQGIIDTSGNARRAAAVAWTRVLYLDELNSDTRQELELFIDLYRGVDHHRAS